MTLVITDSMIEIIKGILEKRPLGAAEMRRVEKMGDLYISQVKPATGKEGYSWLYSFEIDGTSYHFYSSGGGS